MSHISLPRVRRVAIIALGVAIAALLVALYYANHESAGAASNGADKITVSANTDPVFGPGTAVTVLTAHTHNSTTADLAMSLTSECTIATDVTTTGNDTESAEGKVRMWIEIDKKPVPVSNLATPDDGKVTFCNVAHHRTTKFADPNATIDTMDNFGDSNAFNWTALNVGNGDHTIEVKAELTETATNKNTAEAAVGKRTLHVFPGHMAPDATF